MAAELFSVLFINVLVALAWLWGLSGLDRHAGTRRAFRDRAIFFTAGLLSVPLVLVLYELFERGPIAILFWQASGLWSEFLQEFLMVGPVEEFAKFAIFFGLSRLLGSVRDPRDAILQAATVGLAFAFVENIHYCLWYGLKVLLFRSFFCILGHMYLAAIWGYVHGWLHFDTEQRNPRERIAISLAALVPAALVHGLGNFLKSSPVPGLAVLLDFCGLALALAMYRQAGRDSPFRDYSRREWQQAVAAIRQALDRRPDHPELCRRCGFYLLYGRQHAAAAASFAQAIARRPADHYIRIFLGISRMLAGDREAGRAEAEAALLATRVSWRRVRAAIFRFLPDPGEREAVLDQVFARALLSQADRRPVPSVPVSRYPGSARAGGAPDGPRDGGPARSRPVRPGQTGKRPNPESPGR